MKSVPLLPRSFFSYPGLLIRYRSILYESELKSVKYSSRTPLFWHHYALLLTSIRQIDVLRESFKHEFRLFLCNMTQIVIFL